MKIRVIVADDHVIFRQGLAPLFCTQPDIELLDEAANGAQAWALIQSLKPDVAILDIAMPEPSGIAISRLIEASGLATRALLLTMHDDPSAAIEAQEAGAAGYVLKDNSFEDLVVAVRTVAAGGTFVTPSIRARIRELQREGRSTISLSTREREVIRLIARGLSSKEIARDMGLSPRTIDTYRARLMRKLGLHSLADVVRYAVVAGILN